MTRLRLTPMGLRVGGRRYPCTIGRGGIRTDKREGDGATPVGLHRIVAALYRPDRMARPVPWALPVRRGDLWSDDVTQSDYNQMVRAPYAGRHERLWRADRLYDLVVVLDWNWPHADPGRGSAIFMHRWRRPGAPTEGCVALNPTDLQAILKQILPGDIVEVR